MACPREDDPTRAAAATRRLVAVQRDHAACSLGDEAVVLDLASGVYFGLNEVAAFVFELLREPHSDAELLDAVVEEYDVARDQAESDLRELLDAMVGHRLVERADAAGG
jgi:hypothetical protein